MKRRIIIILVLVTVLAVAGAKCIYPFVHEKNVFDQMYYSRVHTDFDWWSPGNFKGKFANMKQLEEISRDSESASTYFEGIFHERYRSEYLNDNTVLEIDFFANKKK